jgi:phage gp29-like protein
MFFAKHFIEQTAAQAREAERQAEPARTYGLRDRLSAAWRSFRERPQMGTVSFASPYDMYGGSPTPYNPSALISYRGYSVIDEMKRDDQVKAALNFKKGSVLAAGWQICVPEGKAEDWEPKEFLEQALDNVEGTFSRSLLEVMSALDYGFSLTELIWEDRDGRIWLRKMATRRPHDITFTITRTGELEAIKQNGRFLPIEKFILYSYDYEFSNFYGHSDLEAVYRAWWTKDNAYKWMAMLLERMGIPPVFALYNQNAYVGNQITQLREVLTNLQAATVGAIPRSDKDALELWTPELAGQVSEVFIPAFEMFNKDIARALLMPGLLGMTDDQAQGSLARSRVHFDVFMLVLERLRGELQDLINEQVIDPLLAFNYPPMEDKPYFEFLPLTEDQVNEIAATWNTLLGGKAVAAQDDDEKHLRNLLGFPEMNPADQQVRMERNQPEMPEGQPGEEGKPPLTEAQFEQLIKEFAA